MAKKKNQAQIKKIKNNDIFLSPLIYYYIFGIYFKVYEPLFSEL